MQYKLYLLLVLLSIFVIGSISVDQKSRKNDSAIDSKKKVVGNDKEDNRHKNKQNNNDDDDDVDVDDLYGPLSSFADNRYSPFSSPEGNYRTRARWPAPPPPSSSYDDFMNGNDWSRAEFPNVFPSSLPSSSYDNNPMLSNGPSCSSLVDPQYPVFSDTCGAVPQARYALPNVFGHRERWQIAQILTNIVGSSTDPACTRSLRLLLCPVLFPPCPARHEPPPVLPCQSYCRAVKARCAIPTLDLLPCEVLPYSSDLCPTNQPYGPFIPPGAYPPMNQPSPMPNGLPPSNYPMPNGFPPSNYPMSRSYPSLQSFMSSQGPQPTLTPSGQSPSPLNPYNGNPYATDSLSQVLADFSSQSYPTDYRQVSRYAPFTRSSTETRPATDIRPQTDTRTATAVRPAAASSVVKA